MSIHILEDENMPYTCSKRGTEETKLINLKQTDNAMAKNEKRQTEKQ